MERFRIYFSVGPSVIRPVAAGRRYLPFQPKLFLLKIRPVFSLFQEVLVSHKLRYLVVSLLSMMLVLSPLAAMRGVRASVVKRNSSPPLSS